ncbi:MAG: hypothetical protein LBH03_07135, partial [Holophagales bacterium]|nr:hypothetical protein [Holophagales bacterium]
SPIMGSSAGRVGRGSKYIHYKEKFRVICKTEVFYASLSKPIPNTIAQHASGSDHPIAESRV